MSHWKAQCGETRMLRVRREARCRIPGATRKNLEDCSWVTQLTRRRKPNGTIACWESDGCLKTWEDRVSQDPCAMVRARLPEAQSPPGERALPSEQRLMTDAATCGGLNAEPPQPPRCR